MPVYLQIVTFPIRVQVKLGPGAMAVTGAGPTGAAAVTGAGGIGVGGQFARQQSCPAHVRFGSKADIGALSLDVPFTPKSGRQLSALGCPLCAISGL